MENSIQLKSIKDILGEKFFIPSYQRGYRWIEQQVKDLLDDIWEFAQQKKDSEFYCLQPVVVTKRNGKREVIDGQQRLTTIYLVLSYLEAERSLSFEMFDLEYPISYLFPNKFQIEFETRKNSQNFLANIEQSKKDENIDYYHICSAVKTIENWFKGRKRVNTFYDTIISDTKIIWYQVNDGSDPVEIFTRINMGKIPLTNAELIKALFLRSDNFGDDKDKIHLKQLEIAGEWDRIEYALQNDEFWYFINKEKNELATRIEFIFDLMSGKKDKNDEYFTFRFFNKKFNGDKKKNIEVIWKEIKDYFMSFEEWFENRELYHLIGYLITVGEKIEGIKTESDGKTKTDFKNYLTGQIKEKVKYDNISGLEYGKDSWKITKVLLLFNIITLLQNEKSNSRFPFDRYKKEKWSLEHIHAQNSEGLNTEKQWKAWIDKHIESLERIDSKKYSDLIDKLKNNTEKITREIFNDLFNDVMKCFKDEGQENNMHGIQNIALLDKDSNSALNNSIFEVKRKVIIGMEKKGAFIPICTRNVFLKYYSDNASQLYFWGKDDRDDYFSSIKETLKGYLPEQTEEAR